MALIDFTDIPPANADRKDQNIFEMFARDFFWSLSYKIEAGPSRGPDGGKDLIVIEHLVGVLTQSTKRWLVSCKHFAHSGTAVSDSDEIDIIGRVEKFKCNGFIAFYSTLPSSALANTLNLLKDRIEIEVFDKARIEHFLATDRRLRSTLQRYFPVTYKNITQSYTWEKFFNALISLAAGRASLQERLAAAWMYSLAMLREDDLPKSLRAEFAELKEQIIRKEPVGDDGLVRAAIWNMDDETAHELAEKIVSIYDRYRVNLIDDLPR